MVIPSTSNASGVSSCSMTTVKFGIRLITRPNRFSKPVQSPAITARRSVLRRIRRQELRRLKALLPSLRRQRDDNVLMIVREAVRYIDQLHSTILARLYSGTLSYESVSERLHPFTMEQIQHGLSHRRNIAAGERQILPSGSSSRGRMQGSINQNQQRQLVLKKVP